MSVIGIDFGDESCYIAVARQGGIETLANDYSLRATPSCVAFTESNRIMGVAAKSQANTNVKNTVLNFKHFIGKKFRNKHVQNALPFLPYKVLELPGGGVGIEVNYLGESKIFNPTEITAMLFTKLKVLAETALSIKVNDVVIGVPCFFDDTQRHALLSAAQGAGLNVLRLFNETTATALAYGIYKQDLPMPEEKPRNVIFVDVGFSSLQVSAAAFNKGKLKMLAATFDADLGGRDFDRVIANQFVEHFKTQYKVDASKNLKAYTKLLTEVEKLKKQMSANSTNLPLNIECFMNDKDVSGRMNRAEFEELAVSLFQRVEETLSSCLRDSGLKLDDIHSVEIVGGSSRVPAIKRIIEKIFHKSPSTTLNQDEAVARGCALQCAMLSPAFKVREFNVQDVQPFGIKLLWQDENGQEGEMEVFPKNHQVPFSKLLTFMRRSPFVLQAEYGPPIPVNERFIGAYTVKDVGPGPDGLSPKVKVKVRVNLHGTFLVASACLKKEEIVEEESQPEEDSEIPVAMETEEKKAEKKDSDAEPNSSEEGTIEETADKEKNSEADDNKKGEKKSGPKKVLRTIDLPVDVNNTAPSAAELLTLTENESKMAASDRLENERINAKNAVEEYVYELRSKLHEELERYVEPDERDKLMATLSATEDWLYEDGENCFKQVYVEKLAELTKQGEPIKERRREREELPRVFETLLSALQRTRKVCDQYRAGDEQYNHIDEADIEKVETAVAEKQSWVEQQMGALNATSKFKPVPVTCSQVRSELSSFEFIVKPIITKPKPKPKAATPPPPPSADKTENETSVPEGDRPGEEKQSNGPSDDTKSKSSEHSRDQPMDVD